MRLPPFERENCEVSESHMIFKFLSSSWRRNCIIFRLMPLKFTIFANTCSHQLSVHSCTGFFLIFDTMYVNTSVLGCHPHVAKRGDGKLGELLKFFRVVTVTWQTIVEKILILQKFTKS